jgi:hypothetical protein
MEQNRYMKAAKRKRADAATSALLGVIVLGGAAHGEIVDRIVAVVDQTTLGAPASAGQIITWSSAYDEARYQAFQSSAEPPQWSPATSAGSPQLREVVVRIIDQLLLEQALNHSPFVPSADEELSKRLQEITSRFPDTGTYQTELARYRISDTELVNRLRREIQLMEFVEVTLRPDARVTTEQIESYYETDFLPSLQRNAEGAGVPANIPTLVEVQEKIQEILTQREIDRRLEDWLRQLRRSAKISLRLQ